MQLTVPPSLLFKQLPSGDLLINSSSGEPSLFTDTPVSLDLSPHRRGSIKTCFSWDLPEHACLSNKPRFFSIKRMDL